MKVNEGWEIEKLIAFNSTTDERKLPTKTIRHVIGDAILIDYHRFLPLFLLQNFLDQSWLDARVVLPFDNR